MPAKLLIMWTARHPDCQVVDVIAESDKAIQIRNCDSGKQAWIPKSGLRQHVPGNLWGVEDRQADESEKVVADWFRAKCTGQQMAALGFAE